MGEVGNPPNVAVTWDIGIASSKAANEDLGKNIMVYERTTLCTKDNGEDVCR